MRPSSSKEFTHIRDFKHIITSTMASSNPRNETQVSTGLPGITRHITGHSPSGKAIIESSEPGKWDSLFDEKLAFDVLYTTSEMPVDLNDNTDLSTHNELTASGTIGLVRPNGTVCRMVDFGPGTPGLMHRTQSLDYGVVIEGEVEMELDDGVKRVLKRGDVAVQRATIHAWKNTSQTEWARMFFVLQDCQKLMIDGKEIGEDVSQAGKEGEGLAEKK